MSSEFVSTICFHHLCAYILCTPVVCVHTHVRTSVLVCKRVNMCKLFGGTMWRGVKGDTVGVLAHCGNLLIMLSHHTMLRLAVTRKSILTTFGTFVCVYVCVQKVLMMSLVCTSCRERYACMPSSRDFIILVFCLTLVVYTNLLVSASSAQQQILGNLPPLYPLGPFICHQLCA